MSRVDVDGHRTVSQIGLLVARGACLMVRRPAVAQPLLRFLRNAVQIFGWCSHRLGRRCEARQTMNPQPIIDKHWPAFHNPRRFRPSTRTALPTCYKRLLWRGWKAYPLTQIEPTRSLRSDQTESPADAQTSDGVSQVAEGAFMNLTSAIQSIHLQVWVTVESTGTLRMESIPLTDERALVHAAGRLFSSGAAEDAAKQIRQAQAGFHRKKADWERRVRQSEDDSARRRAMRELQQKKGYHNPINTRITPAENQFRRLVEALDVHISLENKRELELRRASLKSTSSVPSEQKQIALPTGFLQAMSEAEAAQKATVVKQFFDIEAELTVELASTEQKQMSVRFSPPLPKNRLYYLVDAALVIRLRRVKISNDVFYHNFATQQNEKMSLQSVIESVQAGGVWLQPKSVSIENSSDSES